MQRTEFDPLDFLRLADALVDDGADEATLRTAIGRAYYAVFLLARSKTGVQERRNAHERVREAISPVNHRLASLLGTISTARYYADYELSPVNDDFADWNRNWERVRRNVISVLAELEALPNLTTGEAVDE
jgi:hypothetical protein